MMQIQKFLMDITEDMPIEDAAEVGAIYNKIISRPIYESNGKMSLENAEKYLGEKLQSIGINFNLIQQPTRDKNIVGVRQVCHYFMKKHTSASLSEIGTCIGKKDHATVLHSKKTVLKLMDTRDGYCLFDIMTVSQLVDYLEEGI